MGTRSKNLVSQLCCTRTSTISTVPGTSREYKYRVQYSGTCTVQVQYPESYVQYLYRTILLSSVYQYLYQYCTLSTVSLILPRPDWGPWPLRQFSYATKAQRYKILNHKSQKSLELQSQSLQAFSEQIITFHLNWKCCCYTAHNL